MQFIHPVQSNAFPASNQLDFIILTTAAKTDVSPNSPPYCYPLPHTFLHPTASRRLPGDNALGKSAQVLPHSTKCLPEAYEYVYTCDSCKPPG